MLIAPARRGCSGRAGPPPSTAARSAGATSWVWTSWNSTPGIGQHRAEERDLVERPAGEPELAVDRQQADHRLDQGERSGAGDDAGAEHVGLGAGAGDRIVEDPLELGLVRRVVEALGAARRHVLGQRLRVVGVEPVGGDRRGVDEALRPGADRRLEDVAPALGVDPVRLVGVAEDDEREVDDDVGAGDERVDGVAVEDVAALVGDLVASRARPGRTAGAPCR